MMETSNVKSKREISLEEHEEHINNDSNEVVDVEDAGQISTGGDGEKIDDDDESPVGISWKDSKEVFEEDEKKRKEAVDSVRLKDKEKRRKKNEMFVVQKRNKASKRTYELTKLPEDIVLAVAKKSKLDTENEMREKSVEKVKEKEKLPMKGKRKKKNQDRLKETEHCSVVVVKDEVKKSKKVQESAAEFLNNHLYGQRLHRASTSSHLTLRSKSFGVRKPAVKFNSQA